MTTPSADKLDLVYDLVTGLKKDVSDLRKEVREDMQARDKLLRECQAHCEQKSGACQEEVFKRLRDVEDHKRLDEGAEKQRVFDLQREQVRIQDEQTKHLRAGYIVTGVIAVLLFLGGMVVNHFWVTPKLP